MSDIPDIAQQLMPVLLASYKLLPRETVAMAGEVITAEALISSYDRGPKKARSIEDAEFILDEYEATIAFTASQVAAFIDTQDVQQFTTALTEIRDRLQRLLKLTEPSARAKPAL